jgi:hypothetical protein
LKCETETADRLATRVPSRRVCGQYQQIGALKVKVAVLFSTPDKTYNLKVVTLDHLSGRVLARTELSGEDVEMNPITWRREHQVALVLGVVLGIVLGVVVGYMHGGIRYASLEQWNIESRFRWAILGAFVGACVILIQRLLRT